MRGSAAISMQAGTEGGIQTMALEDDGVGYAVDDNNRDLITEDMTSAVEEALTCDPTRKQLDNILEEQTDVSTLPTQQIPLGIRL